MRKHLLVLPVVLIVFAAMAAAGAAVLRRGGEALPAAVYVPQSAPPEAEAASSAEPEPVEEQPEPSPLKIDAPTVSRVSATELLITWNSPDGANASCALLRKDMTDPEAQWETLAEYPSGGADGDGAYRYSDLLPDALPRQYAYRVDVRADAEAPVPAEPGVPALGSNLLLCLDPGHFEGASVLRGDLLYGYTEAGFVLRLGKQLREDLALRCGISCRMTRESDSITLEGYTDETLDRSHIHLRGKYAEGCDFFISLHTNGNEEDANGYATCSQPKSINKPLMIANTLACASDDALRLCNAVGRNLAAASLREGIAATEAYVPAERGGIREWTQEYNDGLDETGTVCRRLYGGADYYGVLYGAAAAGVPGVIIEHGYHTVPEMRKAAMEGDLCAIWAMADAEGIAEAYGFVCCLPETIE